MDVVHENRDGDLVYSTHQRLEVVVTVVSNEIEIKRGGIGTRSNLLALLCS
jgi:hypothetical protein